MIHHYSYYLLYSALVFFSLTNFSVEATAIDVSNIATLAQDAQWTTCPSSQTDYYPALYMKDCITLSFPLDYSNPALGNVDAFIRRFYQTVPTNNSLWFIAGGPGFSNRPSIPEADYFVALNSSITAYLLDARGTGLSSLLTCNFSNYNPAFTFNPNNESNVEKYERCNQDIIAKYGNITQYYTSYNSALDFIGSVMFVNAKTVAVYAASYGTYFANVVMQLAPDLFDCLVLDGPVPPNRWVLSENGYTNSLASQDVLNLCVQNSSVCQNYLGVQGLIPQLVMQAVYDRTLPCLQYLPWLNASDRIVLTAEFTNFMTGYMTAQPMLGPFWYRLYRCSASDVEQLNHFYSVRISQIYPNLDNVLDYSYGLGMNIGSNEVYSFLPEDEALNYQQAIFTSNLLFSAGPYSIPYAIYESKFPRYTPNPQTYMKFANVSIPILILVGTLDSNTIQGLGVWFQNGLGNTSRLITVPYATHGTVSYDTPCVNSFVIEFLYSLGTAELDTSCLNDLPAPDFDGSEPATQSLSLEYFNTKDLWNNDFQVDVSPTPTPCPSPADDDNTDWSQDQVNSLIIGLVVPLGVIIICLAGYIGYIHLYVLGSKAVPMASQSHIMA